MSSCSSSYAIHLKPEDTKICVCRSRIDMLSAAIEVEENSFETHFQNYI